MGPEIANKNKDCEFHGPYAGRDLYCITQENTKRQFIVTHNASIKPVSYFTGRETELKELCRRIEEGRKSVLISGMGGIGKTHICRKLFEDYTVKNKRNEEVPFKHIGYVEYDGSMDNSLVNCLKYMKQDNPEQNVEAAWRELEYLASDGKLLLFVDNVNATILEDSGLKRLSEIPGAVVLTSRQASFSDEFEAYPIGFLSLEQCRKIYEIIRFDNSGRRIKDEEILDLEYVIDKLAAKHTITVELLAHLARTKTWSVRSLKENLENKGFMLEFHRNGELVNIQKAYEVLYHLSGLTKAEQNILEAFSVFPYVPLAAEVCNQWLLKDAGVDAEEDIIIDLYQKGWLQFDLEQESYAMHPVFAQVIYEKCKPRLENHEGLLEACEEGLCIPESGLAKECLKYLPFAEHIVGKIISENQTDIIDLMDKIVYLQQYIGEYRKAEKYCSLLIKFVSEYRGEEHPQIASIYNNIAGVYSSQGKYEKAEELYKKALKIRERILGDEHPDTAVSYNDLAIVYESEGEYTKAEELYKKSLEIIEKVLGEEHPYTANSYNNLAVLYKNQGKFVKAEELYKKALKIRERILGKDHPNTANSYHNLAAVYESQGEYAKAEKLSKKAIEINEKILGEEHPETAISYNNLANVYKGWGEYAKAEELYKKVIKIIEKVMGEEHPYTANSYNNLAVIYEIQGKYEKAEKLYKKALKIRERILGEGHPETAISYNNVSGIYIRQGEYVEAEELHKKALRVRKRILGEEHPDTANSYNNLAGVYGIQGKYVKAEELYKKAIEITEKILGKKHLNTAQCYTNLANVYFGQKKFEYALEYFVKAYSIFFKLSLKYIDTQTIYIKMKLLYIKLNPKGNFEKWLEDKMN